jgi:hypothetical protein
LSRLLGILGWGLFLAALPLVAVDTDLAGELLRGFEVRGYQCFLGSFLTVLGNPWWTPLWLVVALGNVATALVPLTWFVRPSVRIERVLRAIFTLAALVACSLMFLGDIVGVPRVYAGYYVWCASLLLLAAGAWLQASHTSPEPSRG